MIFSIKDITNNSVSDVTITLTSEGLYWEGVTDEMGQVICTDEMVLTNVESGEILMTCSAQNFLPQEKVLDSGIFTTKLVKKNFKAINNIINYELDPWLMEIKRRSKDIFFCICSNIKSTYRFR